MFLWHEVLQWPQDEFKPFIEAMLRTARNRSIHCYLRARLVYGQK